MGLFVGCEVLLLLTTVVQLLRSQDTHIYPSNAYGPVEQRRCLRPTLIEIPECKNRFYNFTAFPNLVGQETQIDARHQLQTFKPLITYECSNHLTFFLCSVYAPMCDAHTNHLIGPCRPLCERVRKRCSPVLKIFNFDWPANLNCSRFPEKNTVGGTMCMNGPDDPEDTNSGLGKPGVTDSSSPGRESPLLPVVVVVDEDSQTPDNPEASTDGLLRRPLEEPPKQVGGVGHYVNMLDSHIQNLLTPLHQNSLSNNLGSDDTPIALLLSSIRYCSHLAKPTSYVFINRTGRCAPLCMANILFSPFAKTLATVWTSVVSGLCLIATTGTLLSYAIHPSLFHTLERPVIYIAGCQLAYALGFALRLKLGRMSVTCGKDPASGFAIRLQEGLDNSNCALVFLIQYYFFTAGSFWWTLMVTGWASRLSRRLRFFRMNSSPEHMPKVNVGTYTSVKERCCLNRGHGTAEIMPPNQSNLGEKHWRAVTKVLRDPNPHRRMSGDSNAESKCLAKEHVIAWLTPGLLTVAVLVSRQVDADELLGICGVGRQNSRAMLIFVLIPHLLFLLVGVTALIWCCVCLVKLKRTMNQTSIATGAALTNLDSQARFLAFQFDQQSDLERVAAKSPLGCFCCCTHSLGCWDPLSTHLGFFSLLYVVPVISVLGCDFYEYLYRDKWLAGDPMNALSRILMTSNRASVNRTGETTAPEVFLLRTFMSLVTGLATCLWVLSIKGVEPWRRLRRQIASRCSQSPVKSNQSTDPGASLMPLTSEAALKTHGRYSQSNSHSNHSSALHPYAVYQHCCSSGKSNVDAPPDLCHLAVRPPAGPGLDADDQFFMHHCSEQNPYSPTHASGYYSFATKNNSIASESCLQPPRPPPNTPPDSNQGSSAPGAWWEAGMASNGVCPEYQHATSQPSCSGKHTIL